MVEGNDTTVRRCNSNRCLRTSDFLNLLNNRTSVILYSYKKTDIRSLKPTQKTDIKKPAQSLYLSHFSYINSNTRTSDEHQNPKNEHQKDIRFLRKRTSNLQYISKKRTPREHQNWPFSTFLSEKISKNGHQKIPSRAFIYAVLLIYQTDARTSNEHQTNIRPRKNGHI